MKANKILLWLLVLSMIFGLAACGGRQTEEDSAQGGTPSAGTDADKKVDIWAKYDPPITVSTVLMLSNDLLASKAKPADWNGENNPYAWAYKEHLGINLKVQWEAPLESDQYKQKMNVSIASNQLPDIFQVDDIQLNKVVKSGIAQDITNIYDTYISDWARKYTDDGGFALKQATIGGKLLAIPCTTGNYDTANMLWIRKDWLDKLKLNIPKSIDDLYKVAEAFSKQDPDGNNKEDTFGLALSKALWNATGLNGFFDGYDIPATNWIKDGEKLSFGGIHPSVRQGLELIAKMYANKLIDPEFAVKDANKVYTDITAGKIGMFYGAHWNAFFPLPDTRKSPGNENANWRAIPLPTIDGKDPHPNLGRSAATFYVVNKSMKNPEAAVKMLNLMMKYQAGPSPDFEAKYQYGNQVPDNKRATPEAKDVIPSFFRYSAVISFSPTQNYDIYKDNKFVAEGGALDKTRRLMQLSTSDDDAKYLKLRWERLLKEGTVPISDEVAIGKDIKGNPYKEGTLVWNPAAIGSYLWSYPFGGMETEVNYIDKKLARDPVFYGAPTDTMTSKGATLDKLRDETFVAIIMGQKPISEFDKYVNDWKVLGGNDITKEVNEWYKMVQGK